jgi:predicted acetyltransferase
MRALQPECEALRDPDGGNGGLELVSPRLGYAQAFLAMAEEFQAAGEMQYANCLHKIREDFPAYLKEIKGMLGPRGLKPGRVPQSEFWLVDPQRHMVLGTIRFRHALNARLEINGGHIGYAIRPGERGKGYAKRQLAMLLNCLAKSGWQRVLLTCDAENYASARVIEANGGRLEDQCLDETSGRQVNRYWINLEERRGKL